MLPVIQQIIFYMKMQKEANHKQYKESPVGMGRTRQLPQTGFIIGLPLDGFILKFIWNSPTIFVPNLTLNHPPLSWIHKLSSDKETQSLAASNQIIVVELEPPIMKS